MIIWAAIMGGRRIVMQVSGSISQHAQLILVLIVNYKAIIHYLILKSSKPFNALTV